MEYYSAIRKNDYPTFAATWMGLEMIIVFLCLTYFTQHNVSQSHPCCCKYWVIVRSDGQYSIVYMDHIFFILSSVEGHLGSFHDLAIVDNAAMSIGVHMALLFTTSLSLG